MKKKDVLIAVAAVLALGAAGGAALWVRHARTTQPAAVTLDTSQGAYRLLEGNKPFVIRGVCYSPVPPGKDYEYNFWGDPAKPWLADGRAMKDLGVNTVRFYRMGKNPEEVRQVLDDLYHRFGIRALIGSYLGFWNWPPPNYADPGFREKVRAEVIQMVGLYKDHPGVLMWVLGNENNYSFDKNVQRWSTPEIDALPTPEERRLEAARIYYSFVNDLAKEIKRVDAKHPVVMNVGEVASLDVAAQNCPDVDVIGMIAYRGPSFGNLFRQVKQKFDIPIVITEWGADSYNALRQQPDEENQAQFLKAQWKDIERNTVLKNTKANCLGGTLFEWSDEWWKGNENLPQTWSVQDTIAHWGNSSYHYDAEVPGRLNMNEEWWGLMRLDPEDVSDGTPKRVPKKAYSVLKELWAKPA